MNGFFDEFIKRQRERLSLNDQVEYIHRQLMQLTGDGYYRYLDAIYDADAVEGSIAMDDALASIMIRDHARSLNSVGPGGFDKLADANLADVLKALKVVLRRYGASRKERRHTVMEDV